MTHQLSGIDPTVDDDDLTDTRLPETLLGAAGSHRPVHAGEALDREVRDVRAKSVTMERSGAEHVTAQRVTLSNSGARSIEAGSAQVEQAGVLSMQARTAALSQSSVVSLTADEARLSQSAVVFLRAGSVATDDRTRVLVSDVPGVRPLVSIQGAAAFGAALGFVLLALGRLFRRRGA